jgi:hypothetical protein
MIRMGIAGTGNIARSHGRAPARSLLTVVTGE